MTKGIPLTKEELSQRRHEIFNVAKALFLEKGFQKTSMRAIAEAAGMGKSTLYDYFKTKDEIMSFVIEELTEDLTEQAQAVARQDLPPDVRLRKIMHTHLEFMQANRNLFSRLSLDLQMMKPESQTRIKAKRYVHQDMMRSIIEQGIEQGCFRKVDALLAARLLINSLLSVLYTTRPTGSARLMLDEGVSIFFDGIKI